MLIQTHTNPLYNIIHVRKTKQINVFIISDRENLIISIFAVITLILQAHSCCNVNEIRITYAYDLSVKMSAIIEIKKHITRVVVFVLCVN